MRTVHHYASTKIADAPAELVKAINKFSNTYRCVLLGYGTSQPMPGRFDILHAHNKLPPKIITGKTILQYHSEPFQVELRKSVNKKLVISQYLATLPEYSSCQVVRNVIDFTKPEYNLNRVDNIIKIGFSPSRTSKLGSWHDKGYPQTINILNNIKKKYGNLVEIDIITDVSLSECILRKSRCNIIIDECITASYHRSGLEGLALGKLTICSLSPEVESVFLKSSGSSTSPFVNIWMNDLELELCKIIDSGIDYVLEEGETNRLWMNKWWHPETIVNEFVKIYNTL